jgi:peptidoglycan/xylan/chitin deacetylase (PgdA/CDA1 family)
VTPTSDTTGNNSIAKLLLAFDLDGPTGDLLSSNQIWRYPGQFVFGSYGPHRALPRILDILRNYGLRATFFVPAWVLRTWPKLLQRVAEEGHDIAGHGDRHELLFGKSQDEQSRILATSQTTFRNILGKAAVGYRAPSGDFGRETVRLIEEFGYEYSSSMRGGERPYYHSDSQIIEIPAKSFFDDYAVFAYHRDPNYPVGLDRVASYRQAFSSWMAEIIAASYEGLTIPTIWHPKIIGTPGRAILLDEFLGELADNPKVRILGGDTIAEEFKRGGEHA